MSGGRAVPYTLLWGAARGLDLSARAAMYLAALAGSFDAFVFSWYCYGDIPQMDNRVGVLRKLKAHLNPGGRIVISYIPADPSLRRLPIQLTRLMARLTRSDWRPELGDALGTASGRPGAVHCEHHFTEGELEREARAAGLGVAFHERADDGTAILTGP